MADEIYQDEKLDVSTRNIRVIINFCEKHGFDRDLILGGFGYDSEYLTAPDYWVPLSVFIGITERVRHLFNDDPSVFYKIGLTMMDEKIGVLESLKKAFLIAFLTPKFLYSKVPEYNKFFNRTKYFKLIKITKNSAIFKVKFYPGYDPVADFNSGPFIKGILACIPKLWKLPYAKVREVLLEYDVVKLLREQFKILAEIKEGKLLVENEEYGRVVTLIEEEFENEKVCIGKYEEYKESGIKGILISRDYKHKNYLLLEKGQIFNAPYFILKVEWNELPIVRKLLNFVIFPFIKRQVYIEELEKEIYQFQEYTKELELLIQKRTEELRKEKLEVEKWKMAASKIIFSHLPQEIGEMMIKKKLTPRKNQGIVMIADLVNFTARLNTAQNYLDVIEDLRSFFDASNYLVKGENGWVYKYLGDGIMAVFGGYKRNENYHELGIGAIRCAKKLVSYVNSINWQVKIALEFGEFISGEVGPKDERIWDFFGNIINFAFRLEEECNPDEILIGPGLFELLKNDIEVEELELNLRGIGKKKVYRFIKIKEK